MGGLTKKNTDDENIFIYEMKKAGYDGAIFAKEMRESFEKLLTMKKTPKEIRYHHYFRWALKLRNKGIGKFEGKQLPQYHYPESILNYVKSMLPSRYDDAADKDETFDHAFSVNMEQFCQVMGVPKYNEGN